MARRKGYVSALNEAKSTHEKLSLSRHGDLGVHDPVACEMADSLRAMVATLHGDKKLLCGRTIPEIFASHPEGTLGHELVKGTAELLNYIADAVEARNGAALRALATAIDADPEGVNDESKVRSFLVALCLPMKKGGKPYLPAMTRAELQALILKSTGIHKETSQIGAWCKSLGIRMKKGAIGRPG